MADLERQHEPKSRSGTSSDWLVLKIDLTKQPFIRPYTNSRIWCIKSGNDLFRLRHAAIS